MGQTPYSPVISEAIIYPVVGSYIIDQLQGLLTIILDLWKFTVTGKPLRMTSEISSRRCPLSMSASSDVEEIERTSLIPDSYSRRSTICRNKKEVVIDGQPWHLMTCDGQLPALPPIRPTPSMFDKLAAVLRLEDSPPRSPLTKTEERRKQLFFFDDSDRIMIETVDPEYRMGDELDYWAAIGEAEAKRSSSDMNQTDDIIFDRGPRSNVLPLHEQSRRRQRSRSDFVGSPNVVKETRP